MLLSASSSCCWASSFSCSSFELALRKLLGWSLPLGFLGSSLKSRLCLVVHLPGLSPSPCLQLHRKQSHCAMPIESLIFLLISFPCQKVSHPSYFRKPVERHEKREKTVPNRKEAQNMSKSVRMRRSWDVCLSGFLRYFFLTETMFCLRVFLISTISIFSSA